MNINRLKKVVTDYRNLINQKNKSIGSVIKHYRKEKNHTLEETSDGICSVSYLCKVENNQLIPSDTILPKIVDRLEINEDEFFYNENHEWIVEIIQDGKIKEVAYQQYANRIDYKSKIVKFAYSVLNLKNIKKAYKDYENIIEYFLYFTEEEMCFFLYLNMKMYYLQDRYYELAKIFREIELFNRRDIIYLMSKTVLLKALYRLNRLIDARKIYQELVMELLTLNRLKDMNDIRNYELATLAKEMKTDDLNKRLDLISNKDNINLDYIWFSHYYFKLVDYGKAYQHIKNICNDSQHYFIMYLIVLDKLKKENELRLAITNPPFDKFKQVYDLIIRYLKAKYTYTKTIDFIKQEIIYVGFITEESIIVDYLYNEAYREFKNEHFYKGALATLEKHVNVLKSRAEPIF